MASKYKLNLLDKGCIQGMVQNGFCVEDMAKYLDKAESTVQKYVTEFEKTLSAIQKTKKEEKEKVELTQEQKTGIINKTAGKKNQGVSIMTETGAAKGDSFTQSISKKLPKRTKGAIYRQKSKKVE